MSSIWTPGGEHPIGGGDDDPVAEEALDEELDPELVEQVQAQMEATRRELAETPARVVVVNHAMGLYELAAIHLTSSPPQLDEARLAIDAFGLLVQGLEGRLSDEETLREGLQSLQFAYVELARAAGQLDDDA